jgi:hypothetical protein
MKFVPVTVRVNAESPAEAVLGFKDDRVGIGLELPPKPPPELSPEPPPHAARDPQNMTQKIIPMMRFTEIPP